MYLFISGSEIFLVILIVVVFFGADKIPEFARMFGKTMKQVRQATDDIKREINTSGVTKDLKVGGEAIEKSVENSDGIKKLKDIKEDVDAVKDTFNQITGTISRKR